MILKKEKPNAYQCNYFHSSEKMSNFRAKIFKQKMCFRAVICQYKVKIDIDAAVSFFIKR